MTGTNTTLERGAELRRKRLEDIKREEEESDRALQERYPALYPKSETPARQKTPIQHIPETVRSTGKGSGSAPATTTVQKPGKGSGSGSS